MSGTEYVNLLDVITKDYELEDGFEWGIRSVHPDLTSSNDFRWPFPGNWVEMPGEPGFVCPSRVGDGVCTARTWRGMASGGIPAITLLLTAHHKNKILGQTNDKVRVSEIYVVDLIDGQKLVREHGSNADLTGANLFGADLRGADLGGADLFGANLRGADLFGADLARANLTWANLFGADLCGADLARADLRGADLFGADLARANLGGANLCGANLCGADLRGANLRGANLRGANLAWANLLGANMEDCTR